jgi:hypothetical protein
VLDWREDDKDDGDLGEIIRAKWTMDGARTLNAAADQLRAEAERLEALEREGWQLTAPVKDDYGFIARDRRPP